MNQPPIEATRYVCRACWHRTTYYVPPRAPTCERCGARLVKEPAREPGKAAESQGEQGRLL